MALQFGPQWLRNLTDVGAGSVPQPQSPSYGVKFKLADYRYGREEMLALYSENYTPPEQVIKHQTIFSKEIQRPISLNPFSEDEQRLMSQGVNSHIALRSGGRGGISDRGRGRGRGRGGEGYIARQVENNGEQPYVRHASDGWEQVARKPDRSYSRGYVEEQAAPVGKREFLRSSSNNWRDKKEGDEEENNSTGGNPNPNPNAVHWRQPRGNTEVREVRSENTRWVGSSRLNWRTPAPDQDETRPQRARDGETESRGPRKTSESYDSEVPEWAGDDIEDDPGTFDAKGVFVPDRMRGRDGHIQEYHRVPFDGQNSRKRIERNGEAERQKSVKSDHEPSMNNVNNKASISSQAEKASITNSQPKRQSPPVSHHPDINTKSDRKGFNSMKGDGDSVNCGLPYSEKAPSNHSASTGPTGRQEPLYHPQSLKEESTKRVDTNMDGDHAVRVAKMAENENILHMEKSLQNLLAGMTANTEIKSDEEVDVSKGALPLAHKDANRWFYRDPQGKVQGPFDSESMAEWFRIGYFTMSLIVKRGCDDSFKPLGELIKQYGRVPFVPGPPLPPIITSTSQAADVSVPEVSVPSNPAPVMTMPSMATPMVPGMMGTSMPSLHDRLLIRSMMLQQEYLRQSLLVQQLQMQALAKLQEQESFKEYTPDQQHEISMRMMMQNNPLLVQQMQQLQHQQLLLQQEQQQQQQQQQHRHDLHQVQGGVNMGAGVVTSDPFQLPISHPSISLHNINPTSLPTSTLQSSTTTVTDKEAWANSQHTENSIWSQPPSLWDMDNTNETSQAQKIQMEKWKREKEEEKLKEERLHQQHLLNKQDELRKHQIEMHREQLRKEEEELERQRKMNETRRKEEEHLAQMEMERQKKEQIDLMKRQLEEEKRRQEEERKKQEQEKKQEQKKQELLRKQEEKRRKEEERQLSEEKKRQEQIRMQKEQEELRKRLEAEALEAKRKEELQRQMELKQIQEEEERMKRETAEKEKQQLALKKQQVEHQKQQESLRKLQHAQNEQLARIQLPASSNWAKHGSHGGVGHSKSLTEIQEEEASRERERQREQQLQKEMMQAQAALITQQQIQNQKTWAAHGPRGSGSRGLTLWDIQQQEKENAKKSDKGKSQNQPKPSLGSGAGLWGTNSTWEDNHGAPSSAGSIWDMGVPQSIKKPQLGKNSLAAGQNQSQQQSKKNAKTNKKAAATAKPKEVETVQKLFQQNKKQDGFSAWVTEKLSQFSSQIDVPTFVSFIVEVECPDDVLDYVKTYLGDTKETHDFSRQFLEKRNQFKNQMRLQKQLEEDSIWGPAPAINPHSLLSADASKASDSFQTKSKNKKKKKAQKLDGSILGFTVHADSNRKNAAGELETID